MKGSQHNHSIIILDFGGQYAHLIGRRVRECGAYAEILPPETPASKLKSAAGIILSGGPQSVYEQGSPQADKKIFDLGIPILGICYGHQWIAHALGGEVKSGKTKEYGRTELRIEPACRTGRNGELRMSFFEHLPKRFTVWMSHGDTVAKLPEGFVRTASSDDCENAAMEDASRKIFGVQFHLEVVHTEHGIEILRRFVSLCDAAPWSVENFAAHIGEQIKKEVGNRKVFMLVSGGVDSTVAFTLLNQVLGTDRVQGLLVDTGLMRKNEVKQIQDAFEKLGITNLHVEDASDEFFQNLKDVVDPEEKRKIIGDTFLDVQKRVFAVMGLAEKSKIKNQKSKIRQWLLGQGTIYPDTVETGGTKHSDHIKTHHNRVAAIQTMIDQGLVIEPLKELYKDEVRKLGEELGLPHALVWRQPFPGPGLGVRILCSEEGDTNFQFPIFPTGTFGNFQSIFNFQFSILPIRSVGVQGDGRTYRHALVIFAQKLTEDHWKLATEIPNRHREFNRVLFCASQNDPSAFVVTPSAITRERADLLREADSIVDQEMRRAGLYEKIWQFPVVLLPVGSRPGRQSIVLRPVESTEAMTANAARLPDDVLGCITERIMQFPGIDFVFYDLTNKPPATIEWE